MEKTAYYDAVVIGSGQSGKPLATKLTTVGWKTALVEREHVGGSCVNEGCTPTKIMVASARVAYLARRSEDYGVHTGPVAVDMVKIRQRKRDIVESFRSGGERGLERANVELLMGEARFVEPHMIAVHLNDGPTRHIAADKIFIDTGLRPRIPPLEGLDKVPFLDSTSIMEFGSVPEHLLVLGGGYVGLEFGQMFCRFGSRVTIIQKDTQLLSQEDHDIAEAVTDILREDGIEVLLDADAYHVEKDGEGRIRLSVRLPDKSRELVGSHLLVAVGRVPNTESLALDAAGVAVDSQGYIMVNKRLETNVPGIYAMGDVKGGPAFTHISYDDYRILRTNLLEDGNATIEDRLVPYTIYLDPQLGRVGMTEAEARSQGRNIKIAKMPMSSVARAIEVGETHGLMKVVVEAETGQILGAAILGIEGGEIMSMLQLAMMGNLPYTVLQDGIYAHPTLAESLNNLFSGL